MVVCLILCIPYHVNCSSLDQKRDGIALLIAIQVNTKLLVLLLRSLVLCLMLLLGIPVSSLVLLLGILVSWLVVWLRFLP